MMLSVVLFRWRTRENVVPIVDKLSGRMGTPFLLLVFKNALWTALRTIFRQTCTRLQDFAYTISEFSGGYTPDPRKNAPCVWAHTPISAWLASVPIVPVLRNDH